MTVDTGRNLMIKKKKDEQNRIIKPDFVWKAYVGRRHTG